MLLAGDFTDCMRMLQRLVSASKEAPRCLEEDLAGTDGLFAVLCFDHPQLLEKSDKSFVKPETASKDLSALG